MAFPVDPKQVGVEARQKWTEKHQMSHTQW